MARQSGAYLESQLLRRLRQEDHAFEANLGYIMRTCLKTNR
jgi:hypothetical protein